MTDTIDYWTRADENLLREYSITHKLTAPANFIVHTLADVNDQLERGRYFFTDIVRDGIALYEAPGAEFVKAEALSPEQAKSEARSYFEEWRADEQLEPRLDSKLPYVCLSRKPLRLLSRKQPLRN